MTDNYDFLVGTVLGFHALGGEVKVKPSTNNPELLLAMKKVRIQLAPGMKPVSEVQSDGEFKLRSLRLDRKMLVMGFHALPDRTAVEHLEGAKIYCKESDLLPLEEEEFWVKDLVGVEVYTTTGDLIGKVVSIIYGGNDILEILRDGDPPGKTILVPFVRALVPTVDLKQRRIEVTDVPGLLEPQ